MGTGPFTSSFRRALASAVSVERKVRDWLKNLLNTVSVTRAETASERELPL